MAKKILISIAAISLILGALSACSENSSADNALANAPANPTSATLDSCSFVASVGSCGSDAALMKSSAERDSVHFFMNEDGSAVLKESFSSVCPESGEISKISLEKQGGTLFVSVNINYFAEPLGPVRKCACSSNYEIDVPAEFVGTKYLKLNGRSLFDIVVENDN